MHDDLTNLPLGALERPLKIYSRLLETALWLVPNDAAPDDGAAYSLLECRIMLALDLSPRELQALHLSKQIFGGNLMLPDDTDSLRQLYRALLNKFRAAAQCFDRQPDAAGQTEVLRLARYLSQILEQVDQLDEQL